MVKDSASDKRQVLKTELIRKLRWHDYAWVGSICAMFGICFWLFHRMIECYNGGYNSDMDYYAKEVIALRSKPDRLIELLSHALYSINQNTWWFNVYVAAVVAAIVAVNYVVISFYVRLDGKERTVPRYAIQAASILVLFIGPIYSTRFHKFYYKGSFASFAWHNPTQQSMMLFSMITTICILKMLSQYKDGVSGKWWVATAATAFLSATAKPSFIIDLIPTLIILFLGILFVDGRVDVKKRLRNLVIMGLSLLPASIYILMLYGLEFGDTTLNGGAYHIIYGVEVLRQKHDVLIMFLFGMAFAITIAILNYKRFSDRKYFLAILLFFTGLMQWMFIAEDGIRAKHGNFAWGRMYGSYFLTLVCVTILLENIYSEDLSGDGKRKEKKIKLLQTGASLMVLLISLISQFKYFYLIMMGQSFWQ